MSNMTPETLTNIRIELTSPSNNSRVVRLVYSNDESHVTLVGTDELWKRKFSRRSFFEVNNVVASWSVFDGGVNPSFCTIKAAIEAKRQGIESACHIEDHFYVQNQQAIDMNIVAQELELLRLVERFLL